MARLHLVLGDQLSETLSALEGVTGDDVIVMCEVMEEASYVPHHPKKIAFLFAAMRHFAAELSAKGHKLRYVRLDDPANSGSLTSEMARAVTDLAPQGIVVTEPGEFRVLTMMSQWSGRFGVPVEIRPDTRFLCSLDRFRAWAKGKKQLRMEYFYREMRKSTGLLIDAGGGPVGGEWNYDKLNRKPPPKGLTSPHRISHPRSDILAEVLELVAARFPDHFGRLEPFHLAVTRAQALEDLDDFIARILPDFGDYQDAMVKGEVFLNHSLLSTALNAGLLLPLEVCVKAEQAYRQGHVPLNAAEGFIRQILGWREYVRGLYWLMMPDYGEMNVLSATRPLPVLYWGGATRMACLEEVVAQTRDHAYSHHIQRLMVTGNFALLAGLDVKEVQDWYLAVYSDAYEWVEMPNTLGMALFGDGGIMASKPYAASGKYIQRMSNFCKGCHYTPDEMTGAGACPFNALYWDFMVRHRPRLEQNHRLPYVYANWDRFSPDKQQAIRQRAADVLMLMDKGEL